MLDNLPENSGENPFIDITARRDFENAMAKGFWHSVMSWILQKNNNLLPFDEVRQYLPMKGQHYLGSREIEVSKIVGSVSRYNDFDRAFLPRRTYTRGRWMSIDRAHLQYVNLPPIEVYKIGDIYFVRDGNHRVSVARQKGQAFIDAQVIEVDVDVPIDNKTDIETLIRNQEEKEFKDQTCLQSFHPEANLLPTIPGGHEKLLEHIQVHRWYMGTQRHAEVPCPEAAANWYEEVYMPLINVIRETDILKKYPGRTETDLYVWIIEHLYYLREKYQEVTLKEAAIDFSKKKPSRPIHYLLEILNNFFRLFAVEETNRGVEATVPASEEAKNNSGQAT